MNDTHPGSEVPGATAVRTGPGRQGPAEQLAQLTGHVVVCGLHGEALRVVEQLDLAGVAAVVIDDDPDARLVRILGRLEVPLIDADSRESDTLRRAGLAGARALVCVEGDDLHTLATALTARELRPDATVVVQLSNAAVGRALTDIGIRVLDVARLTAPSIVDACLRAGRREMHLGEPFTILEVDCLRSGTLREVYADLVPVAIIRGATGEVEMTPGRDAAIEAGDVVALLGTDEELSRAGLLSRFAAKGDDDAQFVGARAPRPRRTARGQTSLLRSLATAFERQVKVAIGALLGLAVVSVSVLMFGYRESDGRRMSLLDALYFTVETVGTVGYGDFFFRDQPWWLRVWAILLMVVGATLATAFFALLTDIVISRRLEASLGRRRITGMHEHVVLVGVGTIGVAVARRLTERGVPVVAVDRDEDNPYLEELRALRIPIVIADATLPDTWARLQTDRARAVAVMTSNDLANIETGLAVRDLLGSRWARVPVVLRLFDRRMTSTVRASFDFHYVRSPAALAAPWFVGAVLGLEVLDTFFVGDQPMLAARLVVAGNSGLDGLAMRELGASVRVVSVSRADGGRERRPRRDTRLARGDTAYVIGAYDDLIALIRRHAG